MAQTLELEITSSFIKSARYNEVKQMLRIEMGNSFYYYYGITKQKVSRFKKATSKGKYYCKHIKGQFKMIRRTAK